MGILVAGSYYFYCIILPSLSSPDQVGLTESKYPSSPHLFQINDLILYYPFLLYPTSEPPSAQVARGLNVIGDVLQALLDQQSHSIMATLPNNSGNKNNNTDTENKQQKLPSYAIQFAEKVQDLGESLFDFHGKLCSKVKQQPRIDSLLFPQLISLLLYLPNNNHRLFPSK